jgi:hypothetical protein
MLQGNNPCFYWESYKNNKYNNTRLLIVKADITCSSHLTLKSWAEVSIKWREAVTQLVVDVTQCCVNQKWKGCWMLKHVTVFHDRFKVNPSSRWVTVTQSDLNNTLHWTISLLWSALLVPWSCVQQKLKWFSQLEQVCVSQNRVLLYDGQRELTTYLTNSLSN